MRFTNFFVGIIIITLIITGCSDDSADTTNRFAFKGKNISLKNTNLYLVDEDNLYNDEVLTHISKTYSITDGTYTNTDKANGRSLEDYDNATYYIRITLIVPAAQGVATGEYFQDYGISFPGDAYVSHIYYRSGYNAKQLEYYTISDLADASPIIVTGGVADGEIMTIEFKGVLGRYTWVGDGWGEEPTSGTLHIQKIVQDKLSMRIPVGANPF